METKDLVLLILIPIILVSIVVYTDKTPTIIGAVTAEPKPESNRLGVYSINPSFTAKINYDLYDYTKIKDKLDFIIKCSQEGKDVKRCIDDVNKDKAFTWQLGCDKGAEKVLYDFAEFLQDCIDSDDNNCLCRKSMEITKEELQGYLPPTNEYQFTLTEIIPSRRIDIELPNFEGISYSINKNGLSGRIPKIYSLGYDPLESSLKFNLCFIKDEVLNTPVTDIFGSCSETFGPTQQIIIYRNQLKDGAKAIDFVNQKGATLIYPNGNTVKDKNENPLNPINIPNCQIKSKNIYKFCVTQNNYKVVAFDKLDGQIKERNPVIKFASYIPDLPPAPLKNLEAIDRPKAQKSVLLKWDKSDETDIAKFRIYYADSSLNAFDKPTDEIKKSQNVISREIAKDAVEINAPLKLDECEFDFSNKKCLFPDDIEGSKLYFSTFYNAYIYSLSVPEDKKSYDFSVTAVDKNNNEINNIDASQKLPVVKNLQSVDDLPPSSENLVRFNVVISYDTPTKKVTYNFGEKPKISLDGTALSDFNNYKVYYLKYSSLTQEEKARESEKISNNKLKNLKFLANINYEQQGQPFFVDLSATNPNINNFYLFVIVASDLNGNPKEEQYKPKELGAQVIQLAIT